MPTNLENSVVATGLEKVNFHSYPKEVQCQRMFKLPQQLHSFHMLVKLYSNSSRQTSAVCKPITYRCTIGFRKGRGTRDQIANILWIIEKEREFQKKPYTFASLTTLKALTVWITANCGKFLKGWEYQITLPASRETFIWVKMQQNGHRTMNWFKIWN